MLAWILAAGAVLCLAYYAIIVTYAGFGTAFSAVWLFLGIFLGAAAAGVRYYQRYPERIPLWIPVSLVTLCATGVIVLLVVQILIFGRIPSSAEPDLDYVIVLGAQVKPEGLSKTLKLRLDKAAEYARQNPDTLLVLSGAKGANEPVTEASAMREYLLEQGIEDEQMLLEERSYSTVENIAYSKILIEEDREQRHAAELKRTESERRVPGAAIMSEKLAAQMAEKPARIGVLTSNFHLSRARLIARKQGLTDVRGIASESDKVLFVHFCLRASLAILKDRLMGNL